MKRSVKKYKSHFMYHKISMVLVIVGAASFIIVPVLLSLLPQGYFFPLFLVYLAFIAALFINLGVSSSVCKKSERGLMNKIWVESDSSIQAREQMEKYGVRPRSADEFIFSKQRLAELNANRRKEEEFAENAYIESQRLLAEASVPEHCNIIPIYDNDDILKMGRFFRTFDWKIWRENDRLYLYQEEIKFFPKHDMNSPYLTKIEIKDIQYYRIEGSVRNEVRVSGGTVKQDKYTGKVTQTALKTQNISKDDRKTVIKLNIDGVVCEIGSNYDAYDVLFSLIPEKEFERVRKA